jgi:hypothetical protein
VNTLYYNIKLEHHHNIAAKFTGLSKEIQSLTCLSLLSDMYCFDMYSAHILQKLCKAQQLQVQKMMDSN